MQFKKLLVQSIFWRGLYFITVLLLNIVVARYFKAAGSGWIYYVSSLYALIILMSNLSLDSGIAYYASKNEVAINKLINLSLIWTLLIGLAVVAGALIYLQSKPDIKYPYSLIVVSSLSYICGNLLTNYSSCMFYSRRNFRVPSIIMIACNVLLLVILIVAGAGSFSFLSATNFLYIYFLAFLFQGILLVAALLYLYSLHWRPVFLNIEEFKKIMRYALMAFTGNIIFFLVYRVDYFFVKQYCNATDLGNYIQVSKLGQMVILLPSIISSAVFSMVAGGQKEEVNRGLKLLSRISLMVIGTCCLVMAITGPWLFVFVFGNSFDRMYQPFILLIPGILSLSSLYPVTAYYSGKNRLGVNITGSSLALIFIVLGDYFFIPLYGTNAAAIISSIGYMIYHAYVLFIFSREYDSSVAGFFLINKNDFTWLKKFIVKPFA